MLSCLLPRSDELNKSAKDVNDLIMENTKNLDNIHLIKHDNLFEAAETQAANMLHENKHSNREGAVFVFPLFYCSCFSSTLMPGKCHNMLRESRAGKKGLAFSTWNINGINDRIVGDKVDDPCDVM